jgi:hypothetical protein
LPAFRKWFLVLWIAINAADVGWIYYYVKFATIPNPHTVANDVAPHWIGFYVMMYIFGFFWGCVNIFVWYLYFMNSSSFLNRLSKSSDNGPPSRVVRIIWYLLHALIVLPCAAIMCFGPFFSPWAGLKLRQQYVAKHACEIFKLPVDAILEGRHYKSPGQAQVVLYLQNNGIPSHNYLLSGSEDAGYFSLTAVENFVPYALVQNLTYNLAQHSLSANCVADGTALINATTTGTPCMQGFFKFDANSPLEITTNDTRTGTVSTLRAIDAGWSFSKSDDSPNFLIKDANGLAVRSAVTIPGACYKRKVCLASDPGIDMLVSLALALPQQDAYSQACTMPSSG